MDMDGGCPWGALSQLVSDVYRRIFSRIFSPVDGRA
jgi:hypothetical protein